MEEEAAEYLEQYNKTRANPKPVVGFIVAVFKPAVPPTVPTPDAVWQGFIATGTDFSWSVPSFIEVNALKHQICAKVLRAMAGMVSGPRTRVAHEADARFGTSMLTAAFIL